MSDIRKKLLKLAGILVFIGLAMFLTVIIIIKFDFNRLNTMKLETATHTIKDEFNDIEIDVDSANVTFVASEDDICKVICKEPERMKHAVEVKNGILKIKSVDSRKWYDYIGIGFCDYSVRVYLPKAAYDKLELETAIGDIEVPEGFTFGDVDIEASTAKIIWNADVDNSIKISTSTGDITLKAVSIKNSISLSTSTGEIKLNDVSCNSFDAESSTGDITLTDVIAEGGITIDTSTGDVEFEDSDADWLSIKTSTGEVSGTLLSDKIFEADTSTGDVELPKTTTGGSCKIKTSTGDIEIEIR